MSNQTEYVPVPRHVDDVALDLLQLEARHITSSNGIQQVGSYYVQVSIRVVDVQPEFLHLALDLLNVPQLGDRAAFVEMFAEIVTDGTRAQCRKYARWVKSQAK